MKLTWMQMYYLYLFGNENRMQTLGKPCEYLLDLIKNEDQNEMLGLIGVVSGCPPDEAYTLLYTDFM